LITDSSIFWIKLNNSLTLATKNLVKGNQCYNERLVQLNGEEYRIWKHYRSKLAAGIIHGLEILPIIEKSRILYLGASQGITVSHVSDMIGTEGIIYAVEHSHETAKKLQEEVTSKRKNIKPIIMDAAKPSQYQIIDRKVDVVYVDLDQPNEMEIAMLNCKMYLQVGGYLLLMVKTRLVDQYEGKKFIINEKYSLVNTIEEKNRQKHTEKVDLKVNFEILQQINLADFFKEYSMIVAKYLG